MRTLLLHAAADEMVLAVLAGGHLSDIAVERPDADGLVGRVYKGVIRNVVPAIDGVFVDIGEGKNGFLRNKDIHTAGLHTEGASVLVQVEKDATETKGPLLTEKISLAGKYGVVLFHTEYIGVSKKIREEKERESLRHAVKEILPEGLGAIIRTAAHGVEREEFLSDMAGLFRTASVVEKRAKVEKAPALLYRDADLAVKTLRDRMEEDDVLYVDDKETWQRLTDMAGEESKKKQILFYDRPESLFHHFHAEEEIRQLFDREVGLAGGGSIIIDYTEALTAIDVNSGSFKGNMPHSELAYLTNQKAAKEIARQIRLRGIGGMILIDFLDMDKKQQQEKIVTLLKREVAKDHVKTVVCGMTSLGLVEMTRKRTSLRLWQNYYDTCPLCRGTGRILSAPYMAERILEELDARKPYKTGLRILCEKEVGDVLSQKGTVERLLAIVGHDVVIENSGNPNREVYSVLAEE